MNPKTAGNRLPVPPTVAGHHLLYKSELQAPAQASDMAMIAELTKAMVLERGLNPSEIEAFAFSRYAGENPAAHEALRRLLAAMGASDCTDSDACVIACHWAAPHVDELFCGKAFASLVLHTGPERYVVKTFHTGPRKKAKVGLTLSSTTRVVSVGDLLVLDPTTPHLAAPVYPHQDQLLVLLQAEIPDRTAKERNALLEWFKPSPCDKDENEYFLEGLESS